MKVKASAIAVLFLPSISGLRPRSLSDNKTTENAKANSDEASIEGANWYDKGSTGGTWKGKPDPTAEPTPEPTLEPTPEPTLEPTPEPTEPEFEPLCAKWLHLARSVEGYEHWTADDCKFNLHAPAKQQCGGWFSDNFDTSAWEAVDEYCECVGAFELGCEGRIPFGEIPNTDENAVVASQYLSGEGMIPSNYADFCKLAGIWTGDFCPPVELEDKLSDCGCYWLDKVEEFIDECPGVESVDVDAGNTCEAGDGICASWLEKARSVEGYEHWTADDCKFNLHAPVKQQCGGWFSDNFDTSAWEAVDEYCECVGAYELGCEGRIPFGEIPNTDENAVVASQYLSGEGMTPSNYADFCIMAGIWTGDLCAPVELEDKLSDCGCYWLDKVEEFIDECPAVESVLVDDH